MIIGNKFNRKSRAVLKRIGQLAGGNENRKIPVGTINENLKLDRTEIKNLLEYLEELGYINIATIGGPLLYGHVTITGRGLEKYKQLVD